MTTSEPRHYDVIIGPVITEKATMASEHNKVVFKVRKNATKPQIKEAVEKLFDVKVKNVNTLTRKGKLKVFKNKVGQQSDVKRAIVTLEEGHRIDVITLEQLLHGLLAMKGGGIGDRRGRLKAQLRGPAVAVSLLDPPPHFLKLRRHRRSSPCA